MTGGSKKRKRAGLAERGVTHREAARSYSEAAELAGLGKKMPESVAERELILFRQNARRHNPETVDDLGFDPRYAVSVSRQGKDAGAIVRPTDLVLADDPHNPQRAVTVRAVRSGLRRMLGEGAISMRMFAVGEEFQDHFARAGYDRISTVRLDGLRGCGADVEGQMTATMRSRNFVNTMLKCCGYPDTSAGKAAWWIIGMGMGTAEMSRLKDEHIYGGADDSRYWKAMVVAALEMMVIEAQKNMRARSAAKAAQNCDY